MALRTEHKLYIAVGILATLGVASYFQRKSNKEVLAQHSYEGRSAELPRIQLSEDRIKKIDKIVIGQPPGDAGAAQEVVLVKEKDDKWKMEKPVAFPANDTNVKSTLENLGKLEVTEEITPKKESWGKYGVGDDKALHAQFYQGKDLALEAYFGESGSRGQMTRFAGKDGVYAVSGYSSWLYKREPKDWRHRVVFEFDDSKAKTADITNEHGKFSFVREGEKWSGKFQPAKGGALGPIERFEESKVKDFLRAYKSLNADNFGDGKALTDVGLDKPVATVNIVLEDGARRQLSIGSKSTGDNRWAKKADSDQIYSISSWTADWGTGAVEKFQKPDEKKDKDKKGAAPGMPPGMPPGMDPHGHGQPMPPMPEPEE
jgi:hypothetical protein